MVVHLTGRSCDMKSIMKIANKNKIDVIEDCAQAFEQNIKANIVEHLVLWDVFLPIL